MAQQPVIVNSQEPIERIGRLLAPRRGERAGDERGGALAHHASDDLFAQRVGAGRGEHRVGRVGQIASRIDERAVKIKRDEARTHG